MSALPGPRAAHRLLGPRQGPDLLYGAVVTGSVLAVGSAHAESGASVALAAFVVTAIYWLAHVYVDAVGGRLNDPEHSVYSRVFEAMRHTVPILAGAVPPIVIFLAARLLGADVSNAALIALSCTMLMLVAVGAGSAYLAGVRGWRLLLESLVAGFFGVFVILLKYLLH